MRCSIRGFRRFTASERHSGVLMLGPILSKAWALSVGVGGLDCSQERSSWGSSFTHTWSTVSGTYSLPCTVPRKFCYTACGVQLVSAYDDERRQHTAAIAGHKCKKHDGLPYITAIRIFGIPRTHRESPQREQTEYGDQTVKGYQQQHAGRPVTRETQGAIKAWVHLCYDVMTTPHGCSLDIHSTLRSTTMGFWQILAATSLTSSECSVAENISTCSRELCQALHVTSSYRDESFTALRRCMALCTERT